MFDKAKNLYKMQKEARGIQKELKKTNFFSENKGVKVIVNASMELVGIEFEEGAKDSLSDSKLADLIVDLANKAMKKAQKVAAQKMQAIMGNMGGFPGM